tara:strand:- start:52 stop:627 length:576 start_codon:yes stop_codon:yes gene_type:complete
MEVSTNEDDYLEVDTPIPGQNYACLSFISPEKVLKQKERFYMKRFFESLGSFDSKIDDIDSKYDDFISVNEMSLDEDFTKENNFQTSVRGLKIRGVYATVDEAQKRAKMLQQVDRTFHVYVAQVGYWLPFDPSADNVAEQEYLEKELNELMKNYKNNQVQRDVFYANQVQEHKKAAKEAVDKQKQELSQTE